MTSVYSLLYEFPGASFVASAHLTRLANLLSKASKGHYNKDTAVLFRQTARDSIGSVMPAKSLELKHTIKLIQELTSEIDEIEAAIKQIMDEEIKSPILTIPGISYRMGAMIIAESVTSIVLIQQIKYWPMLGCLHPHTNPVNWITVIPVWRNVVPDTFGMPFTMRQNMSAIGINLSVHILKKSVPKENITM